MGRTKSQPVELMEDAPLTDGLTVSLNAMTEHRIEIMQQFGDGLPYERDRIVHEARFYMAQSAEAMLEAGKRLVILKENEPHGEFINVLENELGLPYRTSVRMMQAATKYLSPTLKSNVPALAHLGKTKLFELIAEDDEELSELAEGGTIAGLTLDDIDRMTSRELRAALREARETNVSQQRFLADKNEKIDSLSAKLEKKSRIQPPKPDEEVKKLRAEVTAIGTEAEAAVIVHLSNAFSTLSAYCDEHQLDIPKDFMVGLVCQVERGIHALRETFDLDAAPTGNDIPSWLTEPEPEINRQEA